MPWNFFVKLKISQLRIDFKYAIIVLKLNPSSLTYAMIYFFELYLRNNLIKLFVNACLEVLDVSTSPIAICFGYQSNLKKLITRAKMS